MKVIRDISSARKEIANYLQEGKSTGLVPTMGALHDGHSSLISRCLQENDITITSIFVNPIQFNNPEDLEKYPDTIENDLALLEQMGCDLVFYPEASEMYSSNPLIRFNFGHFDEIMEGQFRPGHFTGVATVVLKLFNILQPDRAYFGQKDLQQFKIIELLVHDLSLDLELVMLPIVREKDGLAMSSRNARLSAQGRQTACEIFKSLKAASLAREQSSLLLKVKEYLAAYPDITIEYIQLVRLEDLLPAIEDTGTDKLVLCFAGYIEGIRLIDNLIIG